MMKKEIMILIILISVIQINASDQGVVLVNIKENDCVLDLKQGWNLFSFCSNLNDTANVTEVLSSISGKYRYVMQWDNTSQSFDAYSPDSPQKPFDDFNDNLSYFIYMYEDSILNLTDQVEAEIEERYLSEGWTTPAYQYRYSSLISTIISGVIDNFVYLIKWNVTNQEFIIYSKKSQNNPFDRIYPGEGRFIYMENSDTITY